MTESPVFGIVLADDEPVARRTLAELLEADPEVDVKASCANGVEALEAVRAHQPDILFLDIEMPGIDGLRVLEELPKEARPAIVVTTAFDRYAVRAFDEEAVDYLLKPFDDERFRQALQRAKSRVRRRETVASDQDYAERLTIHREGGIEVVAVADLRWVQAADQYVRLHLGGGEVLMRESMAELERRLDPQRFLRVHRSALVAVDQVVRLESRSRGGRLLLQDGSWVPVSRSRIPQVRKRLG